MASDSPRTAPTAPTAIHHVQVNVPKDRLEDARQFYGGFLGLPVSANRPAAWGHTGYWFVIGDRELHVGVEEGVDRTLTREHVAYKVDDLGAWRAKFESAGLATRDQPPIDGYERFHTNDPFGHTLEFIRCEKFKLDVDRPAMPKVHLSVALLHDGKLLLVREGKPGMRDKWNLPGGHAERGEFAIDGALRELVEETGVVATASGVLGVFSTSYSIRIVILATASDPKPIAGDEILESRFWTLDDASRLDDAHWINPTMFREILRRLAAGTRFPLEVIGTIRG